MPASHDSHIRERYRLVTLGGAALVGAGGGPVVEQRRRLALLARIAAAGERGVSRDKLLACLSPDSATDSARHALHQLLYYVRQQVGETVFFGTDPLWINPAVIAFDVAEFEAALARDALTEAMAIYRGPFLDGFHLGESLEFEQWVDAERARLAALHRAALFRMATAASARGDREVSLEAWRTLTTLDPLSGRASLGFMHALANCGDRGAALRHGRAHLAYSLAELGVAPDREIHALMQSLRTPSDASS